MAIKVSGTTVIDDSRNLQNSVNLNAAGNVYANTFIGDGSQLTNLPPSGGTVTATASGTLSDGSIVILNSDGTVSVVEIESSSLVGTNTVFETGSNTNGPFFSATYDPVNNCTVVFYRDNNNSNYGTAVVGTVSGTSISFGSSVVFNSGDTHWISSTYDVASGNIVVAYQDVGNSYYGTAIVGTISGTSISFGSEVVFYSTFFENISISYDSTASKVVIFGTDANNNYGYGIVGTVSGTSISFGSAANFVAGSGTSGLASSYDTQANKTVVIYDDLSNSQYPTVKIGTVSGTSISFGTAVVVNSAGATNYDSVYDTGNAKTVVFYRDAGNLNYGTAKVGTVSGTSISFGSAGIYNTGSSYYPRAIYSSVGANIAIIYVDNGSGNAIKTTVGTVSGTSISFESSIATSSSNLDRNAIAYDSTTGLCVLAFSDSANSNKGVARLFQASATNLTSTNYLGISNGAYANNTTATVQVAGSVDDAQSGLTPGQQYFVQADGSIDTTADSTSVFAGTAVAATKLLVKG